MAVTVQVENAHEYYSMREVAAIFGLHYTSIMKAVNRGDIRHIRAGRKVLISRAEVTRLREEGFAVPGSRHETEGEESDA